MTCPLCATDADPAAQIRSVAICSGCGASLVIEEDGAVRRATGADTVALSTPELNTLRKARGRER